MKILEVGPVAARRMLPVQCPTAGFHLPGDIERGWDLLACTIRQLRAVYYTEQISL